MKASKQEEKAAPASYHLLTESASLPPVFLSFAAVAKATFIRKKEERKRERKKRERKKERKKEEKERGTKHFRTSFRTNADRGVVVY